MSEALRTRFRQVCQAIEDCEHNLGLLWPERRRLIREMAEKIDPATGKPWRQKDLAASLEIPINVVHQAIHWRETKLDKAQYYAGIVDRGGEWARRHLEASMAAAEEP